MKSSKSIRAKKILQAERSASGKKKALEFLGISLVWTSLLLSQALRPPPTLKVDLRRPFRTFAPVTKNNSHSSCWNVTKSCACHAKPHVTPFKRCCFFIVSAAYASGMATWCPSVTDGCRQHTNVEPKHLHPQNPQGSTETLRRSLRI